MGEALDFIYVAYIRELEMHAQIDTKAIGGTLFDLADEDLDAPDEADAARGRRRAIPSREAWGRTPDAIDSQRRQQALGEAAPIS